MAPENLLAVLKVQEVVAVAVINLTQNHRLQALQLILCLVLFIGLNVFNNSQATVLDPDRADVLYHNYQGGGMKIDGPAILLRKKATESVAISAYYYVDMISSASVDVMSTASPYSEKRNEAQLGIEYLRDKTLMSMNVRQSDESDYLAKSISINISQDTFGDLTNLSLGLSFGDDQVMRNGDDNFNEQSKHYQLRVGINQIVTANLTANLSIEAIADQGYLNNPYRTVRYIDNTLPAGVGYQVEVYPKTRNSFTSKFSLNYYLPYRAALFLNYRYFSDSWDINSGDIELGYRHPINKSLELEFKLRYYQQSQANFYNDLFPYQDAQNFLARDKELSDFNDFTIGAGVTYTLPAKFSFGDWRSEASLQWDYIDFNYNNFRDPTAKGGVGNEPFYGFTANVVRMFFSLYF
ncbi:MAG: DUF3570 domain-containing protein [Alteromonadaceae bacterium]|nr:DUF3570 domain-containing protein [Alteromonadaceae bacterium]